jgi:secondary thiamine-phosphate synthase enzyme
VTARTRVPSFDVRTTAREQVIDVTASVAEIVTRAGVRDGVAWVFVPHTTAGVTIQENADPTVKSDTLRWLARLIPRDGGFAHGEGNADAHIKASLVGASQAVPVEGGRLALGTWQGVWFCEFDGPRRRRVLVKVMEG